MNGVSNKVTHIVYSHHHAVAQASAVVTDGGSLAAHASLVAREYGIPPSSKPGAADQRAREAHKRMSIGDRF